MLEIVPISLKEANSFVTQYHRHSRPTVGHKFSLAVAEGEKIVGVAIVGRPIARYLDDGWTLEILRTCTDGTPNANSKLYGASARASFAIGYKKVITYSLQTESGTSITAAGFKVVAEVKGQQQWSCKSRPRVEREIYELGKYRWEKTRLKI